MSATTQHKYDNHGALLELDTCQIANTDVKRLCDTGIKTVQINGKIDLVSDGQANASICLDFLSFLKEATARGLVVNWWLDNDGSIDTTLYTHLWPPLLEEGEQSISVATWQQTYRFGKCYWRNGGQFIEVIDKRDLHNQFQHLIDENPMLEIFKAAHKPVSRQGLVAISQEALHDLEAANLVISRGPLCLTMPYRVIDWPIPYRSI